jgi:mttA/Hcf106 family
MLGFTELLVILLVIVVFFPKKIAALGGSLGKRVSSTTEALQQAQGNILKVSDPLISKVTKLSESDFESMLDRLHGMSLISREKQGGGDLLYLHPLVREHYRKVLESDQAQKSRTHNLIERGYRRDLKRSTSHLGETGVEIAVEMVYHLLEKGEIADALKVYSLRVCKGDQLCLSMELGDWDREADLLLRFEQEESTLVREPFYRARGGALYRGFHPSHYWTTIVASQLGKYHTFRGSSVTGIHWYSIFSRNILLLGLWDMRTIGPINLSFLAALRLVVPKAAEILTAIDEKQRDSDSKILAAWLSHLTGGQLKFEQSKDVWDHSGRARFLLYAPSLLDAEMQVWNGLEEKPFETLETYRSKAKVKTVPAILSRILRIEGQARYCLDLEEAEPLLRESLELARSSGDPLVLVESLLALADFMILSAKESLALQFLGEASEEARARMFHLYELKAEVLRALARSQDPLGSDRIEALCRGGAPEAIARWAVYPPVQLASVKRRSPRLLERPEPVPRAAELAASDPSTLEDRPSPRTRADPGP